MGAAAEGRIGDDPVTLGGSLGRPRPGTPVWPARLLKQGGGRLPGNAGDSAGRLAAEGGVRSAVWSDSAVGKLVFGCGGRWRRPGHRMVASAFAGGRALQCAPTIPRACGGWEPHRGPTPYLLDDRQAHDASCPYRGSCRIRARWGDRTRRGCMQRLDDIPLSKEAFKGQGDTCHVHLLTDDLWQEGALDSRVR